MLQLHRVLFSSPQIVKSASLSKIINEAFQKCPSDTYVVVSQPAVNAADYHGPEAAPRLGRNIRGENKNIRSSLMVSDVVMIDAIDSTHSDGLGKGSGSSPLLCVCSF